MNAKTSTIGSAPIKDARVLGKPKMLILGLQHMFAMFGATVLVPILVQSYGLPLNTQTTLFFAGFGTLFFHFCTKLKVPAFLGSSFAFLGGFSAMAELSSGMYATMEPSEKLQYACGGIVIAGLLYVILAAIIKAVGVHRVMHFLPPVVTGPIIVCIGLTLAPSAVSNASTCWPLALIALATIIIFNIWGKGMFKIIPILMGVVVSYIAALIMNACGVTVLNAAGEAIPLIDFTAVREASILGLPPFQMAKFDLTAILVMAPIALATMMEHIGDMSAISSTVGKNFIEDPGLHRSLLGDGLATTMAALFGAPANTTYGENTGVLALTRVYNPAVVRMAAVLAAIFSFCPKFAELIHCMPAATIGGVSLILYGMISAVGVRNVVENQVDFAKSRNVIIAAMIMSLALGIHFSKAGAIVFTVGQVTVSLSGLAVASLVGILLNAVLPGNDYVFGKSEQGDQAVNFKV